MYDANVKRICVAVKVAECIFNCLFCREDHFHFISYDEN